MVVEREEEAAGKKKHYNNGSLVRGGNFVMIKNYSRSLCAHYTPLFRPHTHTLPSRSGGLVFDCVCERFTCIHYVILVPCMGKVCVCVCVRARPSFSSVFPVCSEVMDCKVNRALKARTLNSDGPFGRIYSKWVRRTYIIMTTI